MKKSLLLYVLVMAVVLALGLGNAEAAEFNIDVNCTMKPGGSEEAAINKFKEIVEINPGGRMNVKIFMSGLDCLQWTLIKKTISGMRCSMRNTLLRSLRGLSSFLTN